MYGLCRCRMVLGALQEPHSLFCTLFTVAKVNQRERPLQIKMPWKWATQSPIRISIWAHSSSPIPMGPDRWGPPDSCLTLVGPAQAESHTRNHYPELRQLLLFFLFLHFLSSFQNALKILRPSKRKCFSFFRSALSNFFFFILVDVSLACRKSRGLQ